MLMPMIRPFLPSTVLKYVKHKLPGLSRRKAREFSEQLRDYFHYDEPKGYYLRRDGQLYCETGAEVLSEEELLEELNEMLVIIEMGGRLKESLRKRELRGHERRSR